MAAVSQPQPDQTVNLPVNANLATDGSAPVQAQEAEKVRTFAQTVFLPFTLTVDLAVATIEGVVTVIKAVANVPFRIASYVSGNSKTWSLFKELDKQEKKTEVDVQNIKSALKIFKDAASIQTELNKEVANRIKSLESNTRNLKGALVGTTAAVVILTVSSYFGS